MESLQKRYKYKLASNFVSLFAGGIVALFVPKALGPEMYGNFNFISSFFNSLLNFFQLGTPNAFYTKLSKNQGDTKLIRFYLGFIFLTFLLCFLVVRLLILFEKQDDVWPEIDEWVIYAGFLFSVLTFLVATFKNINDAIGITSSSERSIIIQRLLGVIVILTLFVMNYINLWTFFAYHYLILIFILIVWIRRLLKSEINPWLNKLYRRDIVKYSKDFYKYSHPLILMSVVTLLVSIGDRWLLQKFSGSVQQGYFSFAAQISVLCFIFSSAMTPLLMREFSIGFSNKNFKLVARLFSKNIPLLYFIGAFISIYVAFNKDIIIQIIAGDQYIDGSMAFMLMAFYPIQQSYGQLSGALFFATDQTKLYTNIGITVSVIGLFTTFFLISPSSMGGLDLGATGLAIKSLSIQFLGVTTGLYFNTKYLKLSFIKFMGHKVLVVLLLSILAYSINFISTILVKSIYLQFFLSGFIFLFTTMGILFLYPRLIAQDRKTIIKFLQPLFNLINRKHNKIS